LGSPTSPLVRSGAKLSEPPPWPVVVGDTGLAGSVAPSMNAVPSAPVPKTTPTLPVVASVRRSFPWPRRSRKVLQLPNGSPGFATVPVPALSWKGLSKIVVNVACATTAVAAIITPSRIAASLRLPVVARDGAAMPNPLRRSRYAEPWARGTRAWPGTRRLV
jgi:hypothetical protein